MKVQMELEFIPRTAAKQWTCGVCGSDIPKGAEYTLVNINYGRSLFPKPLRVCSCGVGGVTLKNLEDAQK